MDTAMRLLGRRAHSEKELRDKLCQRRFKEKIVYEIVVECERLQLIDDVEFARIYLQELQAKNLGPRRIRAAMAKRGISKEIIDESLGEGEDLDGMKKRAGEAAKSKLLSLRREKDPKKKREKLIRYLYSRGFFGDLVYQLVDELLKRSKCQPG